MFSNNKRTVTVRLSFVFALSLLLPRTPCTSSELCMNVSVPEVEALSAPHKQHHASLGAAADSTSTLYMDLSFNYSLRGCAGLKHNKHPSSKLYLAGHLCTCQSTCAALPPVSPSFGIWLHFHHRTGRNERPLPLAAILPS